MISGLVSIHLRVPKKTVEVLYQNDREINLREFIIQFIPSHCELTVFVYPGLRATEDETWFGFCLQGTFELCRKSQETSLDMMCTTY